MRKLVSIVLAVFMIMSCAGFVQAATVNDYDVTVYFTGNEGLALKYAPDINAGKYFNIPEGTSLHIDNVSAGWGHTFYNGCDGWVSLQYTKIVGDYPTPQPYNGYISPVYYTVFNTEGEGLELRTVPSTSASTFGPMYDGTVIKAEARSEDWIYGEHNGHYGWAHTHYLRMSNQSEINNYETQHMSQPQPQPQPQAAVTSYSQAYANILNEYREAIALYDWQNYNAGTKAVALCDINGDETPELIFVCGSQEDSQGNPVLMARLHIFTFENGASRELFSDIWGKSKYAGGYFHYYLFLMNNKNSLYYYTDNGDDGGTISYGRFDTGSDGTLTMTDLFVKRYAGSPGGEGYEYYKQNSAITADQYQEQTEYAQSLTGDIVLYTEECGDFAESFLATYGSDAMTVDEALAMLSA